jgi:DNA primase
MASSIEQIKAKLSVSDVVGSYMKLEKAGLNYRGCCPFHNEKTPSFFVSPSRGTYHCFGCNRGGDIISFVQEYEGLNFPEALRVLAQKANIVLPEFKNIPKEDNSRLYQLNQLATEFYQQKLFSASLVAKKVLEYLASRKITEASIKQWNLGLSGEDWDELLLFLKSKDFKEQEIFEAGLIVKKKSGVGYVDRFRKRLMFPITDANAKVVAFTSRTLNSIVYQDDDFGGKYINSPQTAIYDKSKTLYGWHLAKEAVRHKQYLIIVEGNMDAIASQQTGTLNTVAVSGTALTIDQLKLVKRYTNNIILAFDGDTAGSQAVFRSITLGWGVDFNIKVLILPKDSDPADIVKKDPKVWRQAIKDSVPVMDYYLSRVLAGVDLTRADHKKIAVAKLLPIIKFLKSQVEQAHYLNVLSEKIQIPISVLQSDLATSKNFIDKQEKTWQHSLDKKKNTWQLLSEQLLSLAFYKNEFLNKLIDDLEADFIFTDLQSLYKKVIIYYTKHRSLDNLADSLDLEDTEKNDWIRLALTGENDWNDSSGVELVNHFNNLIKQLKRHQYQQQRQVLIDDLRQAELKQETAIVDNLSHKINILNKEINNLQN